MGPSTEDGVSEDPHLYHPLGPRKRGKLRPVGQAAGELPVALDNHLGATWFQDNACSMTLTCNIRHRALRGSAASAGLAIWARRDKPPYNVPE